MTAKEELVEQLHGLYFDHWGVRGGEHWLGIMADFILIQLEAAKRDGKIKGLELAKVDEESQRSLRRINKIILALTQPTKQEKR